MFLHIDIGLMTNIYTENVNRAKFIEEAVYGTIFGYIYDGIFIEVCGETFISRYLSSYTGTTGTYDI